MWNACVNVTFYRCKADRIRTYRMEPNGRRAAADWCYFDGTERVSRSNHWNSWRKFQCLTGSFVFMSRSFTRETITWKDRVLRIRVCCIQCWRQTDTDNIYGNRIRSWWHPYVILFTVQFLAGHRQSMWKLETVPRPYMPSFRSYSTKLGIVCVYCCLFVCLLPSQRRGRYVPY